jgi:hypothetical protein
MLFSTRLLLLLINCTGLKTLVIEFGDHYCVLEFLDDTSRIEWLNILSSTSSQAIIKPSRSVYRKTSHFTCDI